MRTSGGAYSSTVVLWVLVVALVFSTAATAEKADERYLIKMNASEKCSTSRPFCNECTACDFSTNPRCVCGDLFFSCHKFCENCVQSPLLIYPPLYQCMDFNFYYCKNSCDVSGM